MRIFILLLLVSYSCEAQQKFFPNKRRANQPNPTNSSITSPTDIANLHTWLKADALVTNETATTPPADGGSVKGWGDSSGNNHAVFQTGTAYPIYRDGIRASKPGLEFSGTVFLDAGFTALASSTIIVVCRTPTVGSSFGFLCDSTNSSARQSIYKDANTNVFAFSGTGSGITNANVLAVNTWISYSAVFNSGGNDLLYTNGVQSVTGDSGSQSLDGLTVGLSQAHGNAWGTGGYITEIIIYSRALTATEILNLHTGYIAGRWTL